MENSTKQRYFEAVDALYAKIRDTQMENIEAAAHLIADTIAAGGCVSIFDTGHLINSELLNRAGGPVYIRRFGYGISVDNHTRRRDKAAAGVDPSMEGLANFALRASGTLPGDTLILGSVSGKTTNVIDLAVEAKKFGVKLITLSSHEYSSQLESQHTCGKRLFELGDVNIDNCSPFGDAMVDHESYDHKIMPASGIAAAYIMWAVIADATDFIIEKGVTPGMLCSVNFPPNVEYNNGLYRQYEEKGF
ncbi:MAG: sugar isomerase domain-containing protein [Oscillospiraceae bacterium]|nr:sugar isomerase domain-containing protein [Oscillospiraceae bacterium]